ncbi:sulfide dehydrogenase (flavoprotein) subunit SudA [Hydrogenispora ethanolica]|uniref:Sulfide dehydrogenase (Flavoprotein) subunit SudA n=1 Tax=Hydrogenispora ethanolica TaxID=1082276 RepID=A0A4R1RIM7_HYDET|nr:NADPH-dependent glutamate synthase [Hydrogenispora ethanolica]TCL65954.1 sulfide dehydrogenase (flavoprotein) subunit SudA [Hydrogenispora ethanolica]
MPRQVMPKQDPAERSRNFGEVALGFTPEQAAAEAARCLNCKKRFCVQGCPVEVDIPDFIQLLKAGDPAGAAAKIKEKNSLPAICGRVCPQESQCEKECILAKKGEPIAIGGLERFVADYAAEQAGGTVRPAKALPYRAAIIGAGPAGLTAAADLALQGFDVTIFESLHEAGGVLQYGIPQFRLPKEIVGREVEYIKQLGVKLETSVLVGQTVTVPELLEQGFQTIFIGTGAGLPYFLNVPGENLNGVYSANEFLTRVNLMKAYRFPEYDTPVRIGERVAVVGGGNVAMDAARTSLRLGAKAVYIVYRRSEEELPARYEEIENAKEEGIIFRLLTNPVRIIGDEQGVVQALECIRMELGEPDRSGRRRPVAVPGSEFQFPVDSVIVAIGQGPNPVLLRNTTGLQLNERGYIQADPETLATSIPGVFAGGDIVTGAATVIAAMGAGKKAARRMVEYCKQKYPNG